MGANNGTGCPNWLKCAKCKLSRSRGGDTAKAGRLEATGRTKPSRRTGGARMTNRLVEYRCLDCGHIGWSRHIDAARLYDRLPGAGR